MTAARTQFIARPSARCTKVRTYVISPPEPTIPSLLIGSSATLLETGHWQLQPRAVGYDTADWCSGCHNSVWDHSSPGAAPRFQDPRHNPWYVAVHRECPLHVFNGGHALTQRLSVPWLRAASRHGLWPCWFSSTVASPVWPPYLPTWRYSPHVPHAVVHELSCLEADPSTDVTAGSSRQRDTRDQVLSQRREGVELRPGDAGRQYPGSRGTNANTHSVPYRPTTSSGSRRLCAKLLA